ncbi:TnsA-like heteromeric transposase endonuclease subunit [Mycobacteroides abscessus]|uniref:TnsA-like heteromeric transposase endonuclease subunit n=1 Tax=Mycobacteroides abscessus TaxID=36809 RepID=UPI0009A69FAB|nr:TnsA-like heteromeric transposase endonuclease subunit [Mycobacteroides abscessus]SKI12518.1 TnsA endonuclease N terminal protein [Mycobacteroides abscessus subsp. massiliense]SKM20727.1 TnsA endonuclease N terminal protein [Mycobacteroides abscessus subsp. massiliense]
MGSALRTLPVNATDRTRVLARLGGSIENLELSTQLSELPLEQAVAIREFFSWPGKPNYEGLWWSSTARHHVCFESLLEAEYLMAADYDRSVVAIAAQPLAFLWPHAQRPRRSHVPDFFLRLNNGDGCMVDVRDARRVQADQDQFALTRRACLEIGWKYQLFTGIESSVLRTNLRWLSGYRHDRHRPDAHTCTIIGEAFQRGEQLGYGIAEAARIADQGRDVVLTNVFHLMWTQELAVDLHTPLCMQARVSS